MSLMLFASTDPTIVVALIGGGFLALTATITGLFTLRAAKESTRAVADHVTAEGPTLERFETKLDLLLTRFDSHLIKYHGVDE